MLQHDESSKGVKMTDTSIVATSSFDFLKALYKLAKKALGHVVIFSYDSNKNIFLIDC